MKKFPSSPSFLSVFIITDVDFFPNAFSASTKMNHMAVVVYSIDMVSCVK